MPIYEYLCTKCDDLFEVIQKMNDRPLRKCKKCSGKLEKQFSRTAFQLKGDGWFSSGYSKTSGSDSKASDKASDKPEKPEKPGSSDSKSKKDIQSKSGSGSDPKGQLKAASA